MTTRLVTDADAVFLAKTYGTGTTTIGRLLETRKVLIEALERLLDEQVSCDRDNPRVEVWCYTHQTKRCEMDAILAEVRTLLARLHEGGTP